MKKLLICGMAVSILLLVAGPASAWTSHGDRFRYSPHARPPSRFYIGPPLIFVPPPPPVRYYYYRSYPPGDCYDDYGRDDRVWVQGHWEYQRGPYGWERVWVPGHWEWR